MKFRKKPVVIEAFQMTENERIDNSEWPNWLLDAYRKERTELGALYPTNIHEVIGTLSIRTLEGALLVSWNDWIIQGVQGEIYPCKPDIFEATYDNV